MLGITNKNWGYDLNDYPLSFQTNENDFFNTSGFACCKKVNFECYK